MKNLTSRLIGAGLVLSRIFIGGCATNYAARENQRKLDEAGFREITLRDDGFQAWAAKGFKGYTRKENNSLLYK
ncbi:MAG: hypothetical protein AABX17_03065 [Nanoarchaeota archaeon]